MKATIRLFGQFRNHAREPRLEIDLQNDACAQDAKTAILKAIFGENPTPDQCDLVQDSAIASSAEILAPSSLLSSSSQDRIELAILPPVCGG